MLHSIDWQALATLVTGLLAVCGAVVVAQRQTKIAATQANTDRLRLKAELFDRRFAVFQAAQRYIWAVAETSAPPEKSVGEAFREKLDQSQFLFEGEVHRELNKTLTKCSRVFMMRGQIVKLREEGKEDEALLTTYGDLVLSIQHDFFRLPEIFGPEMGLISLAEE